MPPSHFPLFDRTNNISQRVPITAIKFPPAPHYFIPFSTPFSTPPACVASLRRDQIPHSSKNNRKIYKFFSLFSTYAFRQHKGDKQF